MKKKNRFENVPLFQSSFDKRTCFVKIHAPQRVLDRNADILDLQPPVKEFLVTAYSSTNKAVSISGFN